MAVQRKIFRIERGGLGGACAAEPVGDPAALRHQEFMAEIKALRQLIEPRATADRDTMEKARAQIAEAQAYRAELELIYTAMKRTRGEASASSAPNLHAMSRAGRELEAIVVDTEQATQQILRSAEEIDQSANTLSAALKSEHEKGLANDIRDQVLRIYEACNFQDLTGQRVGQVTEILDVLEQHVGRLMEIWRSIEQFKPIVIEGAGDDRKLLNGPKLEGSAGHFTQGDIDQMFGNG